MANTHRILDGIATLHHQYDILVMGGKNVGKTSLIYKFLNRIPPENHESGDELHAKMIDLQRRSKQTTSASSVSSAFEEITILDASSSGEAYASSKSQQVRNAHTILFVYNIANRDSFEALEYMMEGVMVIRSDLPPPFVVVALELESLTEYQVLDYEGAELANRFGALEFIEVSMRCDEEVNHVFQVLVDEALLIRTSGLFPSLDEKLSQACEIEDSIVTEPSLAQNPSNIQELSSKALATEVASTVAPSVESPILIGSAPLLDASSYQGKGSPLSQESQLNSPTPTNSIKKRTTTHIVEVPKSESGCCVIV